MRNWSHYHWIVRILRKSHPYVRNWAGQREVPVYLNEAKGSKKNDDALTSRMKWAKGCAFERKKNEGVGY